MAAWGWMSRDRTALDHDDRALRLGGALAQAAPLVEGARTLRKGGIF
jgi:hypothetical protein